MGFQFTVGGTALTVTELGRWVVSGNSGNHVVKLFNADGTAVPNGSVTVTTAGKPAGQFTYAALGSPVTLAAGTTYAVMSQEVSGGDYWYDYGNTQITLTGDAGGAWAVYAYNNPPPLYGAVGGSGRSYGPVNLKCAWGVSSETRYVYDGMLVIQERNSGNTPTVTYTRGLDLSSTLQGAGGIGGLLARSHGYAAGAWSYHNFYQADAGGNVTAMANNHATAASLVANYRYDPFGRIFYQSGTLASANVYRFSSKEQMPNSGLYYYGFRFYDPLTQRWLNRDPIGERGGLNLYAFVRNMPMGRTDPFGLWPDLGKDFEQCLHNCIGCRLNTDEWKPALRKYAIGHGVGLGGMALSGVGGFAAAAGGLVPVAAVAGVVFAGFGVWEIYEVHRTIDEADRLATQARYDLASCMRRCLAKWGDTEANRDRAADLFSIYK